MESEFLTINFSLARVTELKIVDGTETESLRYHIAFNDRGIEPKNLVYKAEKINGFYDSLEDIARIIVQFGIDNTLYNIKARELPEEISTSYKDGNIFLIENPNRDELSILGYEIMRKSELIKKLDEVMN